MKRNAWKKKIIACCQQAGTYREFFLPVIDTLADILARRDEAQELYNEQKELMVEHTTKTGAVNAELNPLVRLINELNRDALTYWSNMGLTAKGLKQIDENALKTKKRSSLADALQELGG